MGAHRSSRPTGWTSSLRRAARELAGVLSPVWCAGCGREDTVLCRDCAQLLAERTSSPFRAEDQALALPLVPSSAGEDDGMGVLPVVAAASYDGVVARAILAFKDHEVVGLSRLLAPALRAAVETVGEPQRARDGEGHPGWDAGLQGRVQQAGPLLVTPPPTPASLLRRSHRPVDHLLRAVGLRPTGGLVTVMPSAHCARCCGRPPEDPRIGGSTTGPARHAAGDGRRTPQAARSEGAPRRRRAHDWGHPA
ncbi:hypothetical protein [Nesterenkonia sp. PF2B19]|uniref:hypothetical protein n=1 Tax=Nesterenkonia sp. PF2B19 TaxID=1881858 RepID=UPI001F317D57|nr:hypothetical protein [Nesterenkonia sp. PF2B19]